MSGEENEFDAMETGFQEPSGAASSADLGDGDFDSTETGFHDPGSSAGTAPGTGEVNYDALPVGHLLDGHLSVIRMAGKGGMGVVYEVIDTRTQAKYAVKVLHPNLSQNPKMLQMLAQEVASAQNVTHQNLLKVNYFSDRGELKFLVMEYLAGADLMTHIARKGGGLSQEDTYHYGKQIAAGLDYLHNRGLVHLDVKPHNVFVTQSNEVRILDFGIAKAVRAHDKQEEDTAAAAGTLAYMAPEQRLGGAVDRRSDIYAFGLMVAQMMTGKLPFNHRSKADVLAWHDDPNHEISDVGHATLQEALQAAIAHDPSKRPKNCSDIIACLAPGKSGGKAPEKKEERIAPPLPDPDADAKWRQYISRSDFKLQFAGDQYALKSAIPDHPKHCVEEIERLQGLPTFAASSSGVMGVLDLTKRFKDMTVTRVNTLFNRLEKWAYFYPEYRLQFVNLWNNGASTREVMRIETDYFESPTIEKKFEHSWLKPADNRGGAVSTTSSGNKAKKKGFDPSEILSDPVAFFTEHKKVIYIALSVIFVFMVFKGMMSTLSGFQQSIEQQAEDVREKTKETMKKVRADFKKKRAKVERSAESAKPADDSAKPADAEGGSASVPKPLRGEYFSKSVRCGSKGASITITSSRFYVESGDSTCRRDLRIVKVEKDGPFYVLDVARRSRAAKLHIKLTSGGLRVSGPAAGYLNGKFKRTSRYTAKDTDAWTVKTLSEIPANIQGEYFSKTIRCGSKGATVTFTKTSIYVETSDSTCRRNGKIQTAKADGPFVILNFRGDRRRFVLAVKPTKKGIRLSGAGAGYLTGEFKKQ